MEELYQAREHKTEMSLPNDPCGSIAPRVAEHSELVKVLLKLPLGKCASHCFWHGCPQHGTKPRGNAAFWRKKFAVNRKRDLLVTRTLRRAGWRVIRLWEHELKRGTRSAERGTKKEPRSEEHTSELQSR